MMERRWASLLGLLVVGILVSGCLFDSFDEKDEYTAVDKTVDQGTTTRITSALISRVPAIRAEKARLVSGGKKVKLTLSITSAPDPNYTRNDPDYRYHAEYYWVYVSYVSSDRLEAYKTYLVHKDIKDIYLADSEQDKFVRVSP